MPNSTRSGSWPDSQRTKLYNGDTNAQAKMTKAGIGSFDTLTEAQEWTQTVSADVGVIRMVKWKRAAANQRGAWARPGMQFMICTPDTEWGRHPMVLLHELAHLHMGTAPFPWHGWEFAAKLIDIVKVGLGGEAANILKIEYEKLKVKIELPTKKIGADFRWRAARPEKYQEIKYQDDQGHTKRIAQAVVAGTAYWDPRISELEEMIEDGRIHRLK